MAVKESIIKNEYRYNRRFRQYVDKYCKSHGISIEEAISHGIVRRAYLYYTEV